MIIISISGSAYLISFPQYVHKCGLTCELYIWFPGTVTASPSPLGIQGSLTPPPTLSTTGMGSSSNLQLGALMSGASGAGSRLISAAPGAEAAKYRNGGLPGINTNGMFGSNSSLFTKLGTGTRASGVAPTLEKPPGRSRLLEDFRFVHTVF